LLIQICIWPEHCCIGSVGHTLVDTVYQALREWTERTGRSVEFVMKGQNRWTEMYSALSAEVPVSIDTSYNRPLQQSLFCESDQLIVCGQALSHCVNYTLRDIVRDWDPSTQSSTSYRLRHIYLLEDCSSIVPGFEIAARTFRSDMIVAGVQWKKSTDADFFFT
jgi:nicotinamidase/pyrazinamidase